MDSIGVIWDLDHDPNGNVQHIGQHGVTKEEVEEVLDRRYGEYFISDDKQTRTTES